MLAVAALWSKTSSTGLLIPVACPVGCCRLPCQTVLLRVNPSKLSCRCWQPTRQPWSSLSGRASKRPCQVRTSHLHNACIMHTQLQPCRHSCLGLHGVWSCPQSCPWHQLSTGSACQLGLGWAPQQQLLPRARHAAFALSALQPVHWQERVQECLQRHSSPSSTQGLGDTGLKEPSSTRHRHKDVGHW